jgi:hypothetical protein
MSVGPEPHQRGDGVHTAVVGGEVQRRVALLPTPLDRARCAAGDDRDAPRPARPRPLASGPGPPPSPRGRPPQRDGGASAGSARTFVGMGRQGPFCAARPRTCSRASTDAPSPRSCSAACARPCFAAICRAVRPCCRAAGGIEWQSSMSRGGRAAGAGCGRRRASPRRACRCWPLAQPGDKWPLRRPASRHATAARTVGQHSAWICVVSWRRRFAHFLVRK